MSLTRHKFSRRYTFLLQEYLVGGSRTLLRRAVALGRQAVQLGLQTLELAQIHHGAMDSVEAPNRATAGLKGRAQNFFNEVQSSLVERQPAVSLVHQQADKLEGRLKVRKGQLADAHLRLQCDILQRRSLEVKLRKACKQYVELQQHSAKTEASLKHLAHELILAQEEQRRMVRGQLQDEIGQSLLGIGIQLLNLKRALAGSESNLVNGIAITQELVVKSLKLEEPALSP